MKKFWVSVLISIAFLNLLDAFLTLYCLRLGASELNPLMQFALDNGIFIEVKLLVSVAICLSYSKIESLLIRIVLGVVFIMYFLINVNHILIMKILQN